MTKQQMETLRIKQIFNSFGDPDFLKAEQAEILLKNHIANGDFCLLEVATTDKLYIISLLTFEDIWSRNVFALKNLDYYDGFPDLITLYN